MSWKTSKPVGLEAEFILLTITWWKGHSDLQFGQKELRVNNQLKRMRLHGALQGALQGALTTGLLRSPCIQMVKEQQDWNSGGKRPSDVNTLIMAAFGVSPTPGAGKASASALMCLFRVQKFLRRLWSYSGEVMIELEHQLRLPTAT